MLVARGAPLLLNVGARRNLSSAETKLFTEWTLARKPVCGPLVSAPQPPRVPLDRLRAAAQRAVDETSLRKVAKEVGLSPMGLSLFLTGATEQPFPPTMRKLVEWYLRDAAKGRGTDAVTASAALFLLVDGMPPEEAEAARQTMLEVLREGYRRARVPPPAWLNG